MGDTENIIRHLGTLAEAQVNLFSEMRVANLAAVITPFDGTDPTKYRQWKESVLRFAPELSAIETRQLIQRSLRKPAHTVFIRGITQADGQVNRTLTKDQCFQIIESTFLNVNDREAAKQELITAKQRPDEHPTAFAERLKDIAKFAFSATELEDVIRKKDLYSYFIRGLRDEKLQLHLFRKNHDSLDNAVPDAAAYLAEREAVNSMRGGSHDEEEKEAGQAGQSFRYSLAEIAAVTQTNVQAMTKEVTKEVVASLLPELAKLTLSTFTSNDRSRSAQRDETTHNDQPQGRSQPDYSQGYSYQPRNGNRRDEYYRRDYSRGRSNRRDSDASPRRYRDYRGYDRSRPRSQAWRSNSRGRSQDRVRFSDETYYNRRGRDNSRGTRNSSYSRDDSRNRSRRYNRYNSRDRSYSRGRSYDRRDSSSDSRSASGAQQSASQDSRPPTPFRPAETPKKTISLN